MSDPRTVAVLGCCITRDNFNSTFNADHKRWYTVGPTSNQSSVIALMSPPIEPDAEDCPDLSDYDNWNVRSDLSRSVLAEIAAAQPDLLVLDFFGDVHFGVRRLPDGRYLTENTRKTSRTPQYRRWVDAGGSTTLRWSQDPEGYFAVWAPALDDLARFLREQAPRTRVVVHRGFYARRVVTSDHDAPVGLRRTAGLAPLDAAGANRMWQRFDDHAIATHGWDEIDLREERYTSDTRHPWGAFWVHYTADYYHRFLGELHAIDLGTRHGTDVADRVAMIAAAGRERTRGQARSVLATSREQRAQTAERERLGPLRALRRARRSA